MSQLLLFVSFSSSGPACIADSASLETCFNFSPTNQRKVLLKFLSLLHRRPDTSIHFCPLPRYWWSPATRSPCRSTKTCVPPSKPPVIASS
jgi:hypothetical protein